MFAKCVKYSPIIDNAGLLIYGDHCLARKKRKV